MMHARLTRLLIAATAVSLAAAPAFAADVKLGIVQSTSGGSAALYGTMQKNGAELAAAEINASGKLGDLKLVPVHQDDAGDRGQTVNIFQRLINQDKVTVIFGPTLTTSAFAADPIANAAKVPVIASSNTAPGVPAIGEYIFRTSAPEAAVFPRRARLCPEALSAQDGGADLRH